MAKHDENRDLKSVARIGRVNFSDKTIQCPKSATIGINMWGKIDFLTKYCGWHFIWNNDAVVVPIVTTSTSTSSREEKKKKKEPKLTNKKK